MRSLQKLILVVGVVVGASAAFAADVPLPKEKPFHITALGYVVPAASLRNTEVVAQAPATNPDPFNTKREPPAAVPSTVATAVPVVVPVSSDNSILEWIKTAITGAFAAIAAWFTSKFKGGLGKLDEGPTVVGKIDDHNKVQDIVNAVLHPAGTSIIGDPNLRNTVDLALLKAVQSGIPGQAINTGFSFLPGASPIVNVVEPIVRNLVTKFLQERTGASVDPNAKPAVDMEDLIEKVLGRLKEKQS